MLHGEEAARPAHPGPRNSIAEAALSNRQLFEQSVDLLVSPDGDPQAVGLARVSHQADEDLAVLEGLVIAGAGGPPVHQTKLAWLSGTW